MLTFQQLILTLQNYWDQQGCALLQPYDMEVGAGTSHTATFLRALGPEPWRAAYVQPSRRPKDGRYGENPNRAQHYYQYQVVLKPSPPDILELYLGSLAALGFDLKKNDVRFVEDDWENPTLGAWGLGWEVWMNGMEITQFTYFQQVGGLDCNPITGEITYGLERLCMYLQDKESLYDLVWTQWMDNGVQRTLTYGDVYHQNEVEQSTYNFEQSNAPKLFELFSFFESEALRLLEAKLPAARLRNDPEGGAHVQPARCARRHFRNRTGSVHRPHPQPVAPGRDRLRRRARSARLSDVAARTAEGCRMNGDTLLVELFAEELPPKALKKLGEAFAEGLAASLRKDGLLVEGSEVTGYATPRRLAVAMTQVRAVAPDKPFKEKLLPVNLAFDAQGNPTPALVGRLKAKQLSHVDPKSLLREPDGKTESLFYAGIAKGGLAGGRAATPRSTTCSRSCRSPR